MSRRPETGIFILALLGGLLLVYLTLPLAYLFFQIEWREVNNIFADPRTARAVKVSLVTSVVATAIMATLGVPLGYVLARVPFPGRRFVIGVVFVPMMLPPLVGGILLLVLYGPYGAIGMLSEQFGVGLVNSLAGIVLAQVFVASPYIVIASLSAFGAVDVTLEHAAATLGDYRWQIIRRVSLPLAWPGIAAGITLAWVRTLGEFGATLVMAYHPNTLPVFLWVQLTGEGLRGALPLALLLLVIGAGSMAMVYRLGLVPDLGASVAPESWQATRAVDSADEIR